MKKILVIMILMVSLLVSGCGNKYCSVPGCPAEILSFSKYCFDYKCINSSCNNKGIGSYNYCKECISRAY